MNCEDAVNLLSARIDGEITCEDAAPLDMHLAACEACRRKLAEMEIQDAALLRAFVPRQENATEVADRVARAIAPSRRADRLGSSGASGPHFGWLTGLAAAAAVGFVAAILFVKPDHKPRTIVGSAALTDQSLSPVARLTLATGAVFTCPADRREWREMSPHDPIAAGASVRTTGASKCELQLPDGSCVRLNSSTEARFAGDRTVQVSAGQLWSAVARDASPLLICSGDTKVTPNKDANAQFDVTCGGATRKVCVQEGTADVAGTGLHATVHAGEVLNTPTATDIFSCTQIPDPLQNTRWQDDLLVLKPADDAEVLARLDRLLNRIALDQSATKTPGSAEQDIRAHGPAWCPSIAHYLRDRAEKDRDTRRAAAHLLADLATPASIPDLIELLDDGEIEVRASSAAALHRLTGQILGNLAGSAAWREWWKQNESKYPTRK